MPRPKPVNPFYPALIVAGVVFAITACAYGAMTVRGLDPRLADERGLMALLDRHGVAILIVQLVVLAILTCLAIGTDDFWTRRAEARASQPPDPAD
ncbi:MAG: hypothetical protein SFU86_19450 [Pirellulaceae bacterium]|nr:hypothetical protein [Pirellulaceae bacterium]